MVALVIMTLLYERNQALLALITPMLLAEPIAKAFEQKQLIDWRRAANIAMTATLMVGVILGAGRSVFPFVRSDSEWFPTSALESVPPAILSRRVFNDMNFGNFLIYAGVRPMFDDRVELYGDYLGFFFNWDKHGLPWSFTALLDANSIDWALVAPESSFTQFLEHDTKWAHLYSDRFAAAYVRKDVWDAVGKAGIKDTQR